MKKLICALLISLLVVAGCQSNEVVKETTPSSEKNIVNKEREPEADDTMILYKFDNQNFTVTHKSNSLVIEGKDYSIIVEETKEKSGLEKGKYQSIIVEREGSTVTSKLKFTEEPDKINSLSFSDTNNYLAFTGFYSHLGNQLYIIDLNNGGTIDLLEKLTGLGYKRIETIHTYNWGPNKDVISFAFGDPSLSNLAIYDLNSNEITVIPTKSHFINTLSIMWHKKGDFIDYVVEENSDQFKLYRYDLKKSNFELIKEVSRDEFLRKYKQYTPDDLS
ncbi:MAG TPA: hypothetical protein GXX18_12325 [Bacillales bacterium]|nr:hypothetical protein [Bacillales bacterium]